MKSKNKNPTLPFELIVEILLRLPVRSLLRFKSVCKSWLSLISDPQFAKSHFDQDASPTHRILLNFTSDDHKIESLDSEASFQDDSAWVNLNFLAPSPSVTNYPAVLGSCRGFVLSANKVGDLIVWNPSTGVYKRIPDINYEKYSSLLGIGYDSSTADYLVVLIQLVDPKPMEWRTQLKYFSLKTNAWSDVQCIETPYINFGFGLLWNGVGLFLNGAIHWLVVSNLTKLFLIIVFDLTKRNLFEIPLPIHLSTESIYKVYYLRVIGECLSLCYSKRGYTEIWVMKEYKVHSSWTKSFVFSTYHIPRNAFLPIYITKYGGILGSNACKTLVKLNDKGELLEHRSQMQEIGSYCLLHYGVYRESLLSLPRHFREASKND